MLSIQLSKQSHKNREFYFSDLVLFFSKNACFKSIFIWNHFLIVSYSIINRFNHQIIENINIQETAKIKILQIITKTNTTFTNVNLITWKWNFDYKIRYEGQCFSLPFLWIFQYEKVFFLKSNFLYTMDVSRNEEPHVSVTTSLFMALNIGYRVASNERRLINTW